MKTLVMALVCATVLLAAPAFGATLVQKQLSATTSNQTTPLGCNVFTACNDGAANVYINCDATATTSMFPIVSGRCVNVKLTSSCGTLNYIGASASTAPAGLNVVCPR